MIFQSPLPIHTSVHVYVIDCISMNKDTWTVECCVNKLTYMQSLDPSLEVPIFVIKLLNCNSMFIF